MFSDKEYDNKRFRELTLPHLKLLYNVALKYAGKSHIAEDLVQETLYNAFRNFGQLREEQKVKGWLITILRNIYLREIGKEGHFKGLEFDDGYAYIDSLEAFNEGLDPEAHLLKKLEAAKLQNIINKLPEKYKTTFLLFCMEGFSYREISDVLEMPIGTVMSSISRAKAFMKKELLRLSAEESKSKILRLETYR